MLAKWPLGVFNIYYGILMSFSVQVTWPCDGLCLDTVLFALIDSATYNSVGECGLTTRQAGTFVWLKFKVVSLQLMT